MAEEKVGNLLDWTPFIGGLGIMSISAAQNDAIKRIQSAWKQGQRTAAAMRVYTDQLSRQAIHSGLALPSGLPAELEQYILQITREATGTQERLSANRISSFAQAADLRTTVPEFYQALVKNAHRLKDIDMQSLLMGPQLEQAIMKTAKIVQSPIENRRLQQFLSQVEELRGAGAGGNFKEEFLALKESFQSAFHISNADVHAVKRKVMQANGAEEARLIALRISSGRTAIEIKVMQNREFLSKGGSVFIPANWELGEAEVGADVRMMQAAREAISKGLPEKDAIGYLNEVIAKVEQQSVFFGYHEEDPLSPLSRKWLKGRARVLGDTPFEITQNREKVARQAFAEWGRDRTSGQGAGSSTTGVVFSRDFSPEKWNPVGSVVDDKWVKVFEKPTMISQEAQAFRAQHPYSRLAKTLNPSIAGTSYYDAVQETGESLANLNYGIIDESDLLDLQTKYRQQFKINQDRRLFLQMSPDEMIMASEYKDFWQGQRQLTYTLDESHGISNILRESMVNQTPVPEGTFLGVNATKGPIFSGRRGSQEIVQDIERLGEGKIKVYMRNLVDLESASKVFGTGVIKHTVRQTMKLNTIQSLYAYYLENFKNMSGIEARQLASGVTALISKDRIADEVSGVGWQRKFKNPEQELYQWYSALANYQQQMAAAGRPEAEVAAKYLRDFGFKEGDASIAPWVRRQFLMSAREAHGIFSAAQSGPLFEAKRRANFVGSELIRMGPPPQDLGVGGLATFSNEMANIMYDQGLEKEAMHILARTDRDSQQMFRGLAQMLEPFSGKTQLKGTHIENLTAEQLKHSSEHFVGDWLAHRSPNFPEGGVIHFGRSYDGVSYAQLPTDTLQALKGVYLEDGQTAASFLQKKFSNMLFRIREDLLGNKGAMKDVPSFWAARDALQEYYDALGRLIGGKTGAARALTGGKVAGSMQLQAASFPAYIPQEKNTYYFTNKRMSEMLQAVPEEEAAELLKTIDPSGQYRNLQEAFAEGAAFPGMSFRYPGEGSMSALPVNFKSANWALYKARQDHPNIGQFHLSNNVFYSDVATFQLQMGDYDADVAHLVPILDSKIALDLQAKLKDGLVEDYLAHYKEFLQTAGVKGGNTAIFTDELPKILGRLAQQRAGKADIGMISNALSRVREATREAGLYEPGAKRGAQVADWTALIVESVFLKAKHADAATFAAEYDPEELLNHIVGFGLDMDLEKRKNFLLDNYISKVIDPVKGKAALERHGTNIKRSLEVFDQFIGTDKDRFLRQMKTMPEFTTGKQATNMLSKMFQLDGLTAAEISHAADKGGLRSRIQSTLAPAINALRTARRLLTSKTGVKGISPLGWLGIGLAGTVGLTLMRPPKSLTPEQVTGNDLRQEGTLQENPPPQVSFSRRALITAPTENLQTKVRGRVGPNHDAHRLAQQLNLVTGSPTRVMVDDRRKRITREDLRTLRRI